MDGLNYWQSWSGRRPTRRALLRSGGLAAAGFGAATLAGCGSRKTGTGGASPGGAMSGSGQPQNGGVLTHRLNTDPDSLDIHTTATFYAAWPEAPNYNQLLQFDPQDPDNKIIPDLADSYEIAGDGQSVVFKLHPGVTFHDGSPFGSEDVKANIDWIKSPPEKKVSPRQGVLDAVDHVEMPDPLTAKLALKRPNPSLTANLASEFMSMGAKADLAKGDLGTQMNGTGPFRFKSYTRGVGVELERNPNYWVKDRPYLDGIRYSTVVDENTAFTDFLGGQFLRYYPLTPEEYDRVGRETGGKATASSVVALSRRIVFFNGPKKPYGDLRVRQAISLALDRASGIQVVESGKGTPGGYMMPGGDWAIPTDQLKKAPGYEKADVAEAKKLLAAAGVTEPLSGVILTRTDPQFQALAVWVQGTLQKALGWNYTIDVEDNATAYSKAYAGQFDLIAWTVAIAIDDPDATFSEIATTKAVRNWSKIYDTGGDALFDKQTVTVDAAQRKQIVQQMETTFLNSVQVAVMWFSNANHGIYNSVHNYKVTKSLYTNQRYQDVWLSKG